jgi:hypothetical protein
MKKLVLIFILTLCFKFSAQAIEYEVSSKYWNSKTDGPITIEGAINRFFLNSRLDPIEGIWLDRGYGWFAIKKEKNGSYKKWQIKSTSPALNGSVEATFDKTDDSDIYTGSVRIEWPDPNNENWFVFATSKITLKMETIEFIEYSIDRYSAEPESILIRLWPLNFDNYNKEFY